VRGRLILAGVDVDDLDFRDLLAAGEAALFEPMLHGSMTTIDELLDKFESAIIEANPDARTWGTSKQAQEASQAAMDMWAVPETGNEPEGLWLPPGAERPTIPADDRHR
jgi:hypothetical protein